MATADEGHSDWDEPDSHKTDAVVDVFDDKGGHDRKDKSYHIRDDKLAVPGSGVITSRFPDQAGFEGVEEEREVENKVEGSEETEGMDEVEEAKEKKQPSEEMKAPSDVPVCIERQQEYFANNVCDVNGVVRMVGGTWAGSDRLAIPEVAYRRNSQPCVAAKLEISDGQYQPSPDSIHQESTPPRCNDAKQMSQIEYQVEPPVLVEGRDSDQTLKSSMHIECSPHDTASSAEGFSSTTAREQYYLWKDVVNLTREQERETKSLDPSAENKVDVNQERRQKAGRTADDINGGGNISSTYSTEARGQRRDESRAGLLYQSNKSRKGTQVLSEQDMENIILSPPKSVHRHLVVSSVSIRQVEVVGQAVTALSLADAVENILGVFRTAPKPLVGGCHIQWGERNLQHTPLWSLTIRRCQLSSLLPVAGLLHHLDGLRSLAIDGCTGLALTGLQQILAGARCLQTLYLCRCGFSQIPRLYSGSVEILDMSGNALKNATGFETLVRLKVLILAGNKICGLMDLRPIVPLGSGCLRELNLTGNPVQGSPRYRACVVAMIPSIKILDGGAICVHRLWRPGKGVERKNAYTTPSGITGGATGGYFSDSATWAARGAVQKGTEICRPEARKSTLGDTKEKRGYVRGLAGLGLIWAGAPSPQTSPFYGSSSAPTSPTKREGGDSTPWSSKKSNTTIDGIFDRFERWGSGASATSKSSSQQRDCRRPPLPERCCQIESDSARSQPQINWDVRFRHYHHQEMDARNRARARTAGRTRSRQTVEMSRLAKPLRLYGQQIRGDNSIGGWGKTFLVPEEAASQTWNGSFTEFILSECVGLIDRPTALKGADGKWEGVVMNGTGGNKAMLGTIRPVESPQRDAGGDLVGKQPKAAEHLHGGRQSPPLPLPLGRGRNNYNSHRAFMPPKLTLDSRASTRVPSPSPSSQPTSILPSAVAVLGSPRIPTVTPTRATMAVPDASALRLQQPTTRTSEYSSTTQVDSSGNRAGVPKSSGGSIHYPGRTRPAAWSQTPFSRSPTRRQESPSSCRQSAAEFNNALSSPRSPGQGDSRLFLKGKAAGAGREKGGVRGRRGAPRSSRRVRGSSRVLKTSKGFQDIVKRLLKNPLALGGWFPVGGIPFIGCQPEQRNIWQKNSAQPKASMHLEALASWKNIPLENRFATHFPSHPTEPAVATFLGNRQQPTSTDRGRGGQGAMSSDRALSRSAPNKWSLIREEARRKARRYAAFPSGVRSDHHQEQRRCPSQERSTMLISSIDHGLSRKSRVPSCIAPSTNYEKKGYSPVHHPRTGITDNIVPRRLEDWRVPDDVTLRQPMATQEEGSLPRQGWKWR